MVVMQRSLIYNKTCIIQQISHYRVFIIDRSHGLISAGRNNEVADNGGLSVYTDMAPDRETIHCATLKIYYYHYLFKIEHFLVTDLSEMLHNPDTWELLNLNIIIFQKNRSLKLF